MYVGFLILLLFCLQPLWFTDSQELKYLNTKELNLEAIYLISQKNWSNSENLPENCNNTFAKGCLNPLQKYSSTDILQW